jgi:AraC-like DNA-binding protein
MNSRSPKRSPRAATLRVGGAIEILNVLESFGIDPNAVLIEAGIDRGLFDHPGNLITYATRDKLLKHCVARTGCQHFGLLVGQRMNLSALGLIGLLMKTSRDAGSALRSLVDFLHLHSQAAVMTLSVDGELAILTYDAFDPGLVATDQTGDGAVAMMLNVMRSFCGCAFQPTEVSFVHRRPADIGPFRRHFQVPLYFDAKHYALVFSRDWLDVRLSGADEELQQVLQKQVDALGAEHSLELPDQVRSVLRSALMVGQCPEEQIAALFSMRSHTLSRRLETFGTSYHELVNECRFEIARQMLENTSLRISEIGATLGYSRSSSFIRAFRRWSGTTPAQWRKEHD